MPIMAVALTLRSQAPQTSRGWSTWGRSERTCSFVRRDGLRIGVGRIAEPISYPRLRQNVFRFGGVFLDFLAKHPNIGPQILQLTTIFRTPDGAQELDMCQRGIRVLHHKCQEVELGW